MTRVTNSSRAVWARQALEAFVRETHCGRATSELHPDDLRDAIADLIADLGHYADRRFRNRTPFTDLVSRGVGMWSAERARPRGDPEADHPVDIVIHARSCP